MRRRGVLLMLATVVVAAGAAGAGAQAQTADATLQPQLPFIPFGNVYTESNASTGNAVLVYERAIDGRLRLAASVDTGGTGTGAGLGSQGAVALSDNERWLLAVNAGSDDLSVFEVQPRGLRLVDRANAGGTLPISVAIHGSLVYVVNSGNDTIAGFTLSHRGQLRPLPGSTRALSQASSGPAEIAFNAEGDLLIVTEKNTNRLVTFALDRDGLPGEARIHPASGITPFGFAVGRRDRLFVSEAFGGAAGQSALSSYDVDDDGGTVRTISGSVPTRQTSACWVAVTLDGRFAYTANTGSGTISGFAVGFDGSLSRLDANGVTATTGNGSAPADLALSRGGQFLYVRSGGVDTIRGFVVAPNGRLAVVSTLSGVPDSAAGLVAR